MAISKDEVKDCLDEMNNKAFEIVELIIDEEIKTTYSQDSIWIINLSNLEIALYDKSEIPPGIYLPKLSDDLIKLIISNYEQKNWKVELGYDRFGNRCLVFS